MLPYIALKQLLSDPEWMWKFSIEPNLEIWLETESTELWQQIVVALFSLQKEKPSDSTIWSTLQAEAKKLIQQSESLEGHKGFEVLKVQPFLQVKEWLLS